MKIRTLQVSAGSSWGEAQNGDGVNRGTGRFSKRIGDCLSEIQAKPRKPQWTTQALCLIKIRRLLNGLDCLLLGLCLLLHLISGLL